MGMTADYPAPIKLVNGVSGTGVQPNILDISAALTANIPLVMQVVISATATVQVKGAVEVNSAGALVDPVDVSGGGFTASDFYDLILGLPFYQVTITANTGTVTVKVARGATLPGQAGLAQLLRFTNAATQGQ
jgi:hypothetical protein